MGYGVAGIIVIVAGVLAWLSVKSWRWFNIALVFLIVCATAMFGYLSAYTLKVHSAWRSRANEGVLKVDKEILAGQKLLEGERDQNGKLAAGLRQLKQQVQDLIVARGPAWFDAKPGGSGPDGSVEISIESPDPHGVAASSIVYVFEATPATEGGVYLGEFRVSEAGPKTIKLQPNLPLTKAEVARVKASKSLWNIYLKMPTDENDVYAALSDEAAEAVLPKDLDEKYRKGMRTEEELSDWVFLFHDFALQRELIDHQKSQLQNNIERLAQSLADNEKNIADGAKEQTDLEFDKQGFQTELDAVTKYADLLEAKAKKLAVDVTAMRTQNADLAAKLKALQLKAADLINQRTETAQATP